jgi:2-oxoglutarate ferredoxin oxidoreductase subunit alpha
LLSHGDTKHILLFPSSVAECFEFGGTSFDLAERFQTPVFVMSDLDLGMNIWMSEAFEYPEAPIDRGKVLDADALAKVSDWGRYKDVDGDGIPYRTLPGTNHPGAAYFTRGSGHNDYAEYTERPEDYQSTMERLSRKFDTARKSVPAPVLDEESGAKIGFIAYGTTHWAVVESRDQLRNENDIVASYLRIRALPFNDELEEFVNNYDRVYVVEQNRDAQMLQLIRLELAHRPGLLAKLRSILHFDGHPIDARFVTEELLALEQSAE